MRALGRALDLHKAGLVLLVLLATFLLNACGGPAVIPISERQTRLKPQALTLEEYKVRPGDTLSSIAFVTSHNYRDLATWNQIAEPYVIYPGQTLVLKKPLADSTVGAITQPLASNVREEPRPESLAATSLPQEDVSVPSEITSSPSVPATVTSPAIAAATQTVQSTSQQAAPAFNGRWQWPVMGSVIKKFSTANGEKGIDIAGNAGTPVKAAASGRVVYAGSGLRGYGHLVIVQHNDEFLSAYAHNQSLLVAEGDTIRPGQTLAYMGSSGTDRVKLHFEIRRNGDPVDPLKLLPKRST